MTISSIWRTTRSLVPASASSRKFRRGVPLATGVGLLGSMLPALGGPGDFSKSIVVPPLVEEDGWKFDLEIKGWLPRIEMTSAGGSEIDLGPDDILKNLEGTFQAEVGVRKGKWSLNTDIVYLGMEFDDFDRVLDKVNMKEWIVTPKIGYRAFEGDWGYVKLEAGLRYTWAEVAIEGRGPLGRGFDEDVSGDIYDGIVGLSGEYNLCDRWFLPFMLEAGTGDSDSVFAAFAGVGYRYKYADVLFVFKYLSYDFASDAPLQDITVYGPVISARFTF
jgi:hypothetical protein